MPAYINMTLATALNCETIRETFRAWNAERESLDSGLSESLAALEAYQLHLDGWQQQLARERNELQSAREQFERDRSASDKIHAESSTSAIAELHAAREKITALTTLLLSRTEELRTLDNLRAEVQTELELSRARERELQSAIDDQKRSTEDERTEWAEELKQLRDLFQSQLEATVVDESAVTVQRHPPAHVPPTSNGSPRENPLLGSIVEQFGKLRQQRADERQTHTRQR
jgi:predicted  nucleic acid-binding Zn-ribbon protein